jgi:hypothetical protein
MKWDGDNWVIVLQIHDHLIIMFISRTAHYYIIKRM